MNVPWGLNTLRDRKIPGFWIWQGHTRFSIYERMLLNMPETEPKITAQAK